MGSEKLQHPTFWASSSPGGSPICIRDNVYVCRAKRQLVPILQEEAKRILAAGGPTTIPCGDAPDPLQAQIFRSPRVRTK
jgi:hypothetical protein